MVREGMMPCENSFSFLEGIYSPRDLRGSQTMCIQEGKLFIPSGSA